MCPECYECYLVRIRHSNVIQGISLFHFVEIVMMMNPGDIGSAIMDSGKESLVEHILG